MNPLTKVKLINELNEKEAHLGIKDSVSWHAEYKDSAWIFIGGFPYELTEGDIICVFSQYGEIANINLVRDKKTGKSKGFCFLCYEDQRSTILAVDNFNGIKIKGRTLRVDHVSNYRPPKDVEDIDDITKRLREEGCAPKMAASAEDEDVILLKKTKKEKKEKKKKKKEKREKKKEEKRSRQSDSPSAPAVRVKKENEDASYEKYALKGAQESRKERERANDQHSRGERERERDREDERRTGKSKDDARGKDELQQHPRERDCERDRVKDRSRERDGDRERHYREREKEKRRDRDSEYRRN